MLAAGSMVGIVAPGPVALGSSDGCREREKRLGLNPKPATPLVTYCCNELKKLMIDENVVLMSLE